MTLKNEFLNVFNILAAPSEVFADIKEKPHWRIAFIIVLASSMLIGWFMIPAMEQPLRSIYSKSFGENGAEAAMSSMMRMYFVLGVIVQPALAFIRWTVFSIALSCLTRVFNSEAPLQFKQVFSATVYCEIIFILMSTLNVLIIYAKGLEQIETANDLTIFKGLEFFLKNKNENAVLVTLLGSINIFSIWYLIVVSISIRLFTGLKGSESFMLSVIAWLAWMAISLMQPVFVNSIMNIIS